MYSKLALAAAVLGLAASLAYSSEHSSVLDLTSSTYDDAVSDGKVYFIKYFAPWCGRSHHLPSVYSSGDTSVCQYVSVGRATLHGQAAFPDLASCLC